MWIHHGDMWDIELRGCLVNKPPRLDISDKQQQTRHTNQHIISKPRLLLLYLRNFHSSWFMVVTACVRFFSLNCFSQSSVNSSATFHGYWRQSPLLNAINFTDTERIMTDETNNHRV